MFNFFRKFFRKKKDFDYEDQIISSIIYYNEQGGFELEVFLFCSCQDPVNIVKMDDDYDPPVPHFECMHCDRGCKINDCELCKVYSKMANARDLTSE